MKPFPNFPPATPMWLALLIAVGAALCRVVHELDKYVPLP